MPFRAFDAWFDFNVIYCKIYRKELQKCEKDYMAIVYNNDNIATIGNVLKSYFRDAYI
jgi:hypothetical protein